MKEKIVGVVFLSMLVVQFTEGETVLKYAYWAVGFLAIAVLLRKEPI